MMILRWAFSTLMNHTHEPHRFFVALGSILGNLLAISTPRPKRSNNFPAHACPFSNLLNRVKEVTLVTLLRCPIPPKFTQLVFIYNCFFKNFSRKLMFSFNSAVTVLGIFAATICSSRAWVMYDCLLYTLLQVFLEIGKEYILSEKCPSGDYVSLNGANTHETKFSIKKACLELLSRSMPC